MNTTINADSSKLIFKPVTVNRGRKFRGFAYYTGSEYLYQRGYYGSGVNPYIETYYAQLWDPVTKKIVRCNSDYIEDAEVDQTKLNADRQAYINHTIEDTIKWCRSAKSGMSESEVMQFARNVLRKHHPEMIAFIDEAIPDSRNVAVEIENTLRWAMNLTTQAGWMYGRYCAGGKPLSDNRKINAARTALERKGITKLEGFEDTWLMSLSMFGLKLV